MTLRWRWSTGAYVMIVFSLFSILEQWTSVIKEKRLSNGQIDAVLKQVKKGLAVPDFIRLFPAFGLCVNSMHLPPQTVHQRLLYPITAQSLRQWQTGVTSLPASPYEMTLSRASTAG
jgi:hypothetical protein